ATYFAYSQSALVGLIAGSVTIGASLWPRRVTIGLSVATGFASAIGLALVFASLRANRITSNRFHLLELGRRVIDHHPLLAALLAIVFSSLSYNAFFEDPATWIVMALIALVTAAPTTPERPA